MKFIAATLFALIAPGVLSDAAAADRLEPTLAFNFQPSACPAAINRL
jgi:hypothetical protein